MKDQGTSSFREKIPENIAREFSRFRQEVGGYYSERLKSMTTSAIGMGFSRKSVAKAAGVSTTTISNWSVKAPKAKRLKVVGAAEGGWRGEPLSATGLICIRLASGVEMDLPRAELSLEFLETLSRIGGRG